MNPDSASRISPDNYWLSGGFECFERRMLLLQRVPPLFGGDDWGYWQKQLEDPAAAEAFQVSLLLDCWKLPQEGLRQVYCQRKPMVS